MPKMSYEEACRIMNHSINWLYDYEGDHIEPISAAVMRAQGHSTLGREMCAIMGFVVGRAYGIREERKRGHSMSAKIKISYEHPHELDAILDRLKPLVDEVRINASKQPYKTAYLWMKETPLTSNQQNAMMCETDNAEG